jgi:hypothetical protein
MLFLRKLFKLPGPVELGRSKYDALPDRDFSPDLEDDVYTWQSWHEEVKKLHPIKYYIAETAGDFIRYNIWLPITRPITEAIYWLKCHTIKSHRYHMLDLRQECGKGELANIDCYRYGWCDVDNRMLYAMFNLLAEYFKQEPYDLSTHYTMEQIDAEPAYKNQYDNLQEARAIHHWWMVERKQTLKAADELLTRWCNAEDSKEMRQNGEEKKLFEQMHVNDAAFEAKTDEMIARLMRVRRSLWT